MSKMTKFILGALIFMLLLIWGLLYFVFFTSSGADFILQETMAMHFPSTALWMETQGNLVDGIVMENVEFSDIPDFPIPNKLRIQHFYAKADGLSLNKVTAHLQNARLMLPDSDPIVFSLDVADGMIKGNIYTRVLVSNDLSWIPIRIPNHFSAAVQNLDIHFEGDWSGIMFSGSFDIVKVQREHFLFQNSSCTFNLLVKGSKFKAIGLYGEAIFKDGTISGKRTALVSLNEGKLVFDGDPFNPRFDIRASSQVEKVKMDITVNGYFHQPDLYLRSSSGLSQDRLLMMLATNQAWSQTEQGLVDQNLSAGVVKDFLDYFLSGYTHNGRMSWFWDWVRRISVDYDREKGQMGIRTGITDRFEAGYLFEQTKSSQQAGKYKVTGQYQMTDRLFIQGEKDMSSKISGSGDSFQSLTLPDDRIFFKIRQKF